MLVLLGNELILNSLIYTHWNIISMTSSVNYKTIIITDRHFAFQQLSDAF